MRQRITASDLQKLPEADLRHVKVLEQSMENHYMIWASVYPQLALAVDPIAKATTEQRLKQIIAAMKERSGQNIRFFVAGRARSGRTLQEHPRCSRARLTTGCNGRRCVPQLSQSIIADGARLMITGELGTHDKCGSQPSSNSAVDAVDGSSP